MSEENLAITSIPPTHVADLPALMQLAAQLVPTGFLPDHIKTPGQAVAIILSGRELGLSPMLALRSIYMIKGKIELSADIQLSLFKRDGGQAQFVELTEARAELKFKHPNGDTHVESFTMDDARRAGLTGDNWKKYPKAMLRSRVITAGLKSLGFEPKMSGCYAPGEIGGPELAEVVEIETETMPAPKAATPKPNGNGDKPLKERIAALSLWLAGQLGVDDAAWVVPYLRSHTADGSEKNSALMPNEELDALSETSLNNIRADTKGFIERIRAFAKANDQIPGAEIPAKVQVPRDANLDPHSPDAPWRSFLMPWGDNKGTRLADLDKKYLFGMWANFTVETEYNGRAKKEETIARDTFLRTMLDEAGKHYEFTK